MWVLMAEAPHAWRAAAEVYARPIWGRMRLRMRLGRMSGRRGIVPVPASCLVRGGGGCEIRTREGLPPTRFPSVRPRPLGESSGASLQVHGASADPAALDE